VNLEANLVVAPHLAIGATDMRKGFEGFFGIVRQRLLIDPLSRHFLYSATHERTDSRFRIGTGSSSSDVVFPFCSDQSALYM